MHGFNDGGRSAYYPKAMADKIIGAMLEVTSWHEAVQVMNDAAAKKACMTAEKEKHDEKPLDEKEKKEVMRWLQLLHERSAHTSMISIAEGLRRQGASAEVIKMAKDINVLHVKSAAYHLRGHMWVLNNPLKFLKYANQISANGSIR